MQLKHAGRSVMVELNNQFDEAEPGRRLRARSAARRSPNSPAWRSRRRPIRHAEPAAATAPARRSGQPINPAWCSRRRPLGLRRASPKRQRRRGIQAGPGTTGARRPAGDRTARRRREARGGRPQRRDHGPMADVPAQRQATAARVGQRVRRTALRLLAGSSSSCAPVRRTVWSASNATGAGACACFRVRRCSCSAAPSGPAS